MQNGPEHLGGAHAMLSVVAETRDDARLVMIVPVEAVPTDFGQASLPAPENRLEVAQAQRAMVPPRLAVVDLDVLELEDHVELMAARIGVESGLFDSYAWHLADGDQAFTSGEDFAVHLLEELVDARPVDEVRHAVAVEAAVAHVAVGQLGVFGDEVDYVHAEAVDAALQPPAHHGVECLADLRVLPVEVGLLTREQVQVVLARFVVELPSRAGEYRAPVVRFGTRIARAHAHACGAPPVPVALRVVFGGARLDEPGVLV